jgi:Uma2 family endonuclease
MTTALSIDSELIYPDSDGQPMSDNTKPFRWIVLIKENLEILFAYDPQVFVAGDLLWYPVQGRPDIRVAPDAMVVFGRPKGDRGSYQQWVEENVTPQVVFEILSPGNTVLGMNRKLLFYQHYGVSEYYLYDPESINLGGFIRTNESMLEEIPEMQGWVNPKLGIRFELAESDLVLYRPDGRRFLASVELDQRAEQERDRADSAQAQVNRLAARLRELGVDPEQV